MPEAQDLANWLLAHHQHKGEDSITQGIPFLAVLRNDHGFAIPLTQVRLVARLESFSPLPGAPPLLPGATSLQGRIVALLDLGPLVEEETLKPRVGMYVTVVSDGDVEAGLIVTRALDMHLVPDEYIQKEDVTPYIMGRYAWPLSDPQEAFDIIQVANVLDAARHVFK